MSLSNIKPFVRKPYRKASSSDQIPLQSYVQVDEAQSEYDVFRSQRASTIQGPQQQHVDESRHRLFLFLTLISIGFLVLNVVQIALIFTINARWWLLWLPLGLFLLCIGLLVYEYYRKREILNRSWTDADWSTRAARVGIAATVFLNILACEFGYVNGVAVKIAHEKIWRVSLAAESSFAPLAMALAQNTFFRGDRAILASDPTLLNELWVNKSETVNPSNQRSFTNFGSFTMVDVVNGIAQATINYVTYNGSYDRNITTSMDLDLFFYYYYSVPNSDAPLDLMIFDPKFLTDGLFEKAYECGLITAFLFPARGRSQVSLEIITIDDEVKAFNYSYNPQCDIDAFRHYNTYRTSFISYEVNNDPGCLISSSTPPPDQTNPLPCMGDVDIHFSSMLVTKQTSDYAKDWVGMLTDEGGIVGGIMFVTWFLGILSQ